LRFKIAPPLQAALLFYFKYLNRFPDAVLKRLCTRNPGSNLSKNLIGFGGRPAIWQRYEEATYCQRRPTGPMDPGDAADLSIMG